MALNFSLKAKTLLKFDQHIRTMRLSHIMPNFKMILNEIIDVTHQSGTYKEERIITSKQAVNITVKGSKRELLNFCSNNYLGFSDHPEVVKAAKEALLKYGIGVSSARCTCGTQEIHTELEERIAKYHKRESAILYSSCYDANGALFEAVLEPKDVIFSDQLNHASIIDGIRLGKAQKVLYNHKDMNDLEKKLSSSNSSRMRMIVTDGVFSMGGDVTPLDRICDLADRYDALVFIDDSHATGIFGATGRGTEEFFDLGYNRVDIINSTLGKALGGAAGGYTAGPKELISVLRHRARPYLFSNSVPPSVVASGIKVFELLENDSGFVEKIQGNTNRFRTQMIDAGFTINGDHHPISPVMLTDSRLTLKFADKMLEHGIYVMGFCYPFVPEGKARIRVQLSAKHSFEDIDRAVEAFKLVGRELDVI